MAFNSEEHSHWFWQLPTRPCSHSSWPGVTSATIAKIELQAYFIDVQLVHPSANAFSLQIWVDGEDGISIVVQQVLAIDSIKLFRKASSLRGSLRFN